MRNPGARRRPASCMSAKYYIRTLLFLCMVLMLYLSHRAAQASSSAAASPTAKAPPSVQIEHKTITFDVHTSTITNDEVPSTHADPQKIETIPEQQPRPATSRWNLLNTNFIFSPAASIPEYCLKEHAAAATTNTSKLPHVWRTDAGPLDRPPKSVGSSRFGGEYDGTTFTLYKQSSPKGPLKYRLLFRKGETPSVKGSRAAVFTGKVPYIPWTANMWALFPLLPTKGYTLADNTIDEKANLYITRGEVPANTDERRDLANNIGKNACLAGTKSQQLMCKQEFVAMHQCSLDSLDISPRQFTLHDLEECKRFFRENEDDKSKMYIFKPAGAEHGDGIELFYGTSELRARFGRCIHKNGALIMDYVANPALVHGRKVDLRTFLLVASTHPKLVFYHQGYSRLASANFTTRDFDSRIHISNSRNQSMFVGRFMNHTQLAMRMHAEHGFGVDKLKDYLRRRAKAVTRFVFEASLTEIRHTRGRFQIYALDWSMDDTGKLGLLEVNAAPLLAQFPWINLTPKVWHDFLDLALKIQINPSELNGPNKKPQMLVKENYKYEGWELVFNELEAWYEKEHGRAYNPCVEFDPSKWKMDVMEDPTSLPLQT